MLLTLPACGPADVPDGGAVTHAKPLIYGDDDREELYELDSEALRAVLMQSVVALIPKESLIADLKLTGVPTLGERANLCSEERFRLQPAAALCTGVLLDWDLILTAGHCVRALPLDQLAAVFGYAYSAPDELALSPTGIYDLSEIVAERLDPAGAPSRLDYAWIRLSHDAKPPLRPLAVTREISAPDQPLIVAATNDGVPLKVDRGGTVRDPGAPAYDFFTADSDTSRGASGGVALDARHAVLGVLARGGADLVATERGCFQTRREPAAGAAHEQFTYAARGLKGLCSESSGSSSLCRANCGDPCQAQPRPPPPGTGCSITEGSARSDKSVFMALFWLSVLRRRRSSSTAARRRGARNQNDRVPKADLNRRFRRAPAGWPPRSVSSIPRSRQGGGAPKATRASGAAPASWSSADVLEFGRRPSARR